MKKFWSILVTVILTVIIIMLTYTLIYATKNGFNLEEIEKIPENIKKEEKIKMDTNIDSKCKKNEKTATGTINLPSEASQIIKKAYVELLAQTASGNIEVD